MQRSRLDTLTLGALAGKKGAVRGRAVCCGQFLRSGAEPKHDLQLCRCSEVGKRGMGRRSGTCTRSKTEYLVRTGLGSPSAPRKNGRLEKKVRGGRRTGEGGGGGGKGKGSGLI